MKNKREITLTILLLLILLLLYFLIFPYKNTNKKTVSSSLNSFQSDKNSDSSNLNSSYFDDFRGVWGNGTPDGGTTWSAGDSRYAEQSMPASIVHPLTGIKTEQEKIMPAEIKRPDANNTYGMEDATINTIIDENIAKAGILLGGFFSNKGEMITSRMAFDVDSDGIKEDVIETANFGGNHPPHNGYIIKKNIIIWYIALDAGSINQAKDGNGFYVNNPIRDDGSPLCCSIGYRRYRLIYDKKNFIPVWEQEVHYLRFDK